ncbi:peptidoglycan-binding protein [Amedibacillus dolichus]|uniref:Peptidoglycan-binding protein n=1 Tax=Amedibacillus dolichus TaxID=31971 RepID=A0ABT7UA31_9FIRM|nr:peptidoglycan-binding protein [Amedibacillus dolichus]MDM8156477.1 peptidoglycan-binding protein [Amedibacillus dolichus]
MTDQEGKTVNIPLYAPDIDLSLEEDNDVRPYETYNVEMRLSGYEVLEIQNVQIFAEESSYLPLHPTPTRRQVFPGRSVSNIVDHHLLTNYGGNNQGQTPANLGRILGQVTIPTYITVHLGRPQNAAENVTVPFLYYLKNVACSEIYPTWPYEALKANIWAQASLALNRIYTEWYPSQGYDFDITNSTAFDQAFVKDRNIFDSVAVVVNEVFNQYIQKANYQEPYYAEYCDGKIASCPGMKQWGTLSLANQGYTAIEILRYYYGDSILIRESNNIQDIQASYPGVLRIGSSGQEVREMQEFLNAIAINYPAIPVIFPVDGIFNESTEAAVRVFQRQFNLTVDGIVGKATWYKISYIYAAVRKLAELTSIGRIEDLYSGQYPGTPLQEGDRGVEVQLLQYYLSAIAVFYPQIPNVSIDGRFGPELFKAVLNFQRSFGLIEDGIVGRETWNRIYALYETLSDKIVPDESIPEYPGMTLQQGSSGENVRRIQTALNNISAQYPSIPLLVEDGIFGTATTTAVRAFQRQFGLTVDGIVGVLTWNKIFEVSALIDTGEEAGEEMPPYPGTLLRNGSRGNAVRLMQERLKSISIYYPVIPDITADGIFGPATQAAVIAFQQMMGITADGIIGQQTWELINTVYNELFY